MARNEAELQNKIALLQIATGKEYAFLTIYPTKNGVVAWYYSKDDSIGAVKNALK